MVDEHDLIPTNAYTYISSTKFADPKEGMSKVLVSEVQRREADDAG